MRPLLIFGATRGVGLELGRQERQGGRRVFAFVRPGSESGPLSDLGVEIVTGDALDRETVAAAFGLVPEGAEVVSTIGGRAADGRRADDEGNLNLITEAQRAGGIARFVLVTSIGCGEMAPFRSARAIAVFGEAVDAKTKAEEALRASSLAWTIIRPGGLLSEPATGQGILSTDARMHGFIHRSDVAELIRRVLRDPATIGGAFAAVDAGSARTVNPVEPFPLAGAPAR
ncbi:epimerase [Bosea sp. Root381]|uniref:SDR family oxidoreductase n=1 Tax=Bosea sp. Root381 TaxID=1736524 RepID=UPI0006F9C302|nr:SDR family oxidoreductase [Bosea sp. Root381]KRE11288.1 epimerase [Bosea sp. Root381]